MLQCVPETERRGKSRADRKQIRPEAGRWGLFNGEKPVFEVDVNTGELRVNGRPVSIVCKD
jgi:hypothetical protein